MHRTDAIAWVITVCAASLRLSQAKTLSILVAAALHVQRASLANLGRCALGSTKHQIKRAYRFCANDRVEPADAMRGIVKRLVKNRKKPLVVALDWVDIRGFQTLVASAVLRGRSVPLCWSSTTGHVYDGHKSRNAFEESLLLVLRSMIPLSVKVIILADRGFGRCCAGGVSSPQRLQLRDPRAAEGHGEAQGIPRQAAGLPGAQGNRQGAQGRGLPRRRGRHAARRGPLAKGLPPKRDECWFLMTDLTGTAEPLCQLYGRRMTIEQLFRDHKSKRNGWSLRDTQFKTPQRLDRLLLVLAIAYLLLVGLGLIAQTRHKPSAWCSSSKERCSVFLIGMVMRERLRASPSQALAAVLDLSLHVAAKWG